MRPLANRADALYARVVIAAEVVAQAIPAVDAIIGATVESPVTLPRARCLVAGVSATMSLTMGDVGEGLYAVHVWPVGLV